MLTLPKILVPWRDRAVFCALAALGALMVARYAGAERIFYFWDHALYPQWAFDSFMAFENGFAGGARHILASLNDDYGRLYTLGAMPFFALWGPSRLVYLLANFTVYGLGLALVLGGITARLAGYSYWRAAWISLLALLGAAFVWIPLVEGYPDIGGMAIFGLAFLWLMRDWPQPGWRAWVGAGCALAISILFRRHFLYPTACLLLGAGLTQIYWLWRAGEKPRAILKAAALGAPLTLATGAALLYALAPEFVIRLVTANYPALYASYPEEAVPLFDKQVMLVGPFSIMAACAGFWIFWKKHAEARARLSLLIAVTVLWGILWFGFVRFGGKHYLMHILPIVIPLGWIMLLHELWAGERRERRVIAALTGLLLAVQACLCFWFGDLLLPNAERRPLTGFFAASAPPPIRGDGAEIVNLVNYLHATTGADDRIAVLASSHLFNQDMLVDADRRRREQSALAGARLPIIPMPEVDRRDPLPLNTIAQANVLVLAIPPQYHLGRKGQIVVDSAVEALTMRKEFGELWRQDKQQFPLDAGVTVFVYRLVAPWTPAARLKAMRLLSELAAPSGSARQDWVTIRADTNSRIATDAQFRTAMIGGAVAASGAKPFQAWLMLPLPANPYALGGKLAGQSGCSFSAQLRQTDGDGATLSLKDIAFRPDGTFFLPVPETAAQEFYLQLEISAAPMKNRMMCNFSVEDLQVAVKRN